MPLAKWAGLGTILGYLAAGVLIGPYGLGLVSDSETIHQIADFGIVMMLFLIGLELQPAELWRMRHKVLGLGVTQMVGHHASSSRCRAWLLGFAWQTSPSSSAWRSPCRRPPSPCSRWQQRDITRTDTGRASLAVLLVQDVAVIPILAAIPLLADRRVARRGRSARSSEAVPRSSTTPSTGWLPLTSIGAFIAAMLAGRFVIRPLMRFVARTGVPRGLHRARRWRWSSARRC